MMMNEWGIPNWRDVSTYGDTSSWSENRWRWEFLRRRADLRDEFDREAPLEYAHKLELAKSAPNLFPNGVLRPDDPGFYVPTRSIGGDLMQPLPNPRIGDQPQYAIAFTDMMPALRREYEGEKVTGHPKEVTLTFDLTQPISAQIDIAKRYLQEEQHAQIGQKVQWRSHKTKWLDRLRVLDAIEAGVGPKEILETFIENEVWDCETSSEKKFYQTLEAAHALQFSRAIS